MNPSNKKNTDPIRRLLDQLWNGIFIHPDTLDYNVLASRENIYAQLDMCNLSIDDNGRISASDLSDLVLYDNVDHIGNIYDRDPDQFDWYYSLYAIPKAQAEHLPINSIATFIVRGKRLEVRGPVLAVKNGPASGFWDIDETVSDEEFAKTVWWYLRSGRDVEEEFGMRSLFRILAKEV